VTDDLDEAPAPGGDVAQPDGARPDPAQAGMAMGLGIALGAGIGAALGNVAIGIGVGVALGAAITAVRTRRGS
jgi:hypothetical protein